MKIDKIRVIILVVMISSLGLLARGYIHFSDIHQWPTTKGKVISYESGENTYVVHSMRSMQSTGSVEWNKVKYEYSIDGVTHTGNRISPNIRATYPYKTENVAVFYNPKDHSESYLSAGRYYNPILIGIFVASILILGVDLLTKSQRQN